MNSISDIVSAQPTLFPTSNEADAETQKNALAGPMPEQQSIRGSEPRNHTTEKRAAALVLASSLANAKEILSGPEPQKLVQIAKALVLCGLPYKETKQRTITRRAQICDEIDGTTTLIVTYQANLQGVSLPFGADRKPLFWFTDRAIKLNSPFVPLSNISDYFDDIELCSGGGNYKRNREAFRRIAGMSITVERHTSRADSAIIMPVFEAHNLPRVLRSGTLQFPSSDLSLPYGVQFSPSFFNELKNGHIPFPWALLKSVSTKPQMLDYMMFLHWRSWAAQSESLITWSQVRAQVWQNDTNIQRTRPRFEEAIAALKTVWPALPARATKAGLLIWKIPQGKELIRGSIRRA